MISHPGLTTATMRIKPRIPIHCQQVMPIPSSGTNTFPGKMFKPGKKIGLSLLCEVVKGEVPAIF